jgi:glycosyltransferase involved in cell wall biosynthesis
LVITVANITGLTLKKKGLDTFVKASAYLPNIRFILVGKYDNSSVEPLKRIAGSNVIFIGYVSDDSLVALYRKAKVYCQLSAHESFGVALAEAMACGCVPVVTRRYALPEVVGDAGFYVPHGDPKATAEAIKKALKSNKGKLARERIRTYFSLETREQKLINEIINLFWRRV